MANAAPWDAAWHPGRRHRSLSWAACCCSLLEQGIHCSLFSQVSLPAGLYSEFYVFSTAEISNTNLMRGWRECGPRDMLHKHEDTHAAKLQSTNTGDPSGQHGLSRSAGFMWKAFSSAGAAEDVAIVGLGDGWRSYVSVSADWNAAEFIRLKISKVTTSRWNPRKPNTVSEYTQERRHHASEHGRVENITIDKELFTVNVGQI